MTFKTELSQKSITKI